MSGWGTLAGLWLALGPEVAVPEVVSAAAEAVALTWEAPAGCPDAEDVRRALAGYLGEGPSTEAGAAVRAVAQVSESGGSYRLSLRTETASGVTTRETAAGDCAVLVDATAVIVAIAVDPATVFGRNEEPPRSTTPRAPVELVAPLDEPELGPELGPELEPGAGSARSAGPEPFSEPPVRFGLRVGGGIDVGVLPGLAGGLRVAGAVLGRRWRAELRGDYWLPRTAVAQPGIGARVSLLSLGARGCWVPELARPPLEFPLCAGVEVGAMRGDPVGERVASPSPSRRSWGAVDGSAGLAWVPRRYLALMIQAELVVPILRAGFRVGEVEVHRATEVAGRALAGLEVRFP